MMKGELAAREQRRDRDAAAVDSVERERIGRVAGGAERARDDDRSEGGARPGRADQRLDRRVERLAARADVRVREGDQLALGLAQAGDHRVQLSGPARRRLAAEEHAGAPGASARVVLADGVEHERQRGLALVIEDEDRLDRPRVAVVERGAQVQVQASVEALDRAYHRERRVAVERAQARRRPQRHEHEPQVLPSRGQQHEREHRE
ncbi:MAG: hypothetical protein M5U28_27395 [Sandaracinaceae bacterium]|nr:hypothetical protein [Sandaracinaceae bacterium]